MLSTGTVKVTSFMFAVVIPMSWMKCAKWDTDYQPNDVHEADSGRIDSEKSNRSKAKADKPGSETRIGEDSMTFAPLRPVSSSNSRMAAVSAVSEASIKPYDEQAHGSIE